MRRWADLVLALLALWALAGCASFDPHGVYQRQSPGTRLQAQAPQPPLDAKTRAEGVAQVWRTLRDRYVDAAPAGIDWTALGERYRAAVLAAPDDPGYWEQLDRLAGELRDGHTRVESPRQVRLRDRHGRLPYGFDVRVFEERLHVAWVDPRSPAAQAGIRAGHRVLRADGADAYAAWAALRHNIRPSSTPRAEDLAATQAWFNGFPDTPVLFEFEPVDRGGDRGPDAHPQSLRVPLLRRELPSTRVQSRQLASGAGYVAFGGFDARVEGEVLEALRAWRGAPGLVVDLRGNRGGSFHMAQRLASALTPTAADYGLTRTRTGEPVTMFFGLTEVIGRRLRVEPPARGAYAGPVVVLIDAASASGSELMAGALRALGRARLVGETSCGCLLGVLGPLPLPGGGRLSFSEVAFDLWGGVGRIEGLGLVPDETVPVRLADLAGGHDAALAAAEAWLARASVPGAPGAPVSASASGPASAAAVRKAP